MEKQILYTVPAFTSFKNYIRGLFDALFNRQLVIIFNKQQVRALYKQAYPRAKV